MLELGTAELGPIACQLSDVVPRVPSWSRRPCRVLAWTDGLKVEIGYHPHDASAASLVVDTPEGGGCSWVSICPVVDSVDTLWLAYRRAGQVACVVGVSLASPTQPVLLGPPVVVECVVALTWRPVGPPCLLVLDGKSVRGLGVGIGVGGDSALPVVEAWSLPATGGLKRCAWSGDGSSFLACAAGEYRVHYPPQALPSGAADGKATVDTSASSAGLLSDVRTPGERSSCDEERVDLGAAVGSVSAVCYAGPQRWVVACERPVGVVTSGTSLLPSVSAGSGAGSAAGGYASGGSGSRSAVGATRATTSPLDVLMNIQEGVPEAGAEPAECPVASLLVVQRCGSGPLSAGVQGSPYSVCCRAQLPQPLWVPDLLAHCGSSSQGRPSDGVDTIVLGSSRAAVPVFVYHLATKSAVTLTLVARATLPAGSVPRSLSLSLTKSGVHLSFMQSKRDAHESSASFTALSKGKWQISQWDGVLADMVVPVHATSDAGSGGPGAPARPAIAVLSSSDGSDGSGDDADAADMVLKALQSRAMKPTLGVGAGGPRGPGTPAIPASLLRGNAPPAVLPPSASDPSSRSVTDVDTLVDGARVMLQAAQARLARVQASSTFSSNSRVALVLAQCARAEAAIALAMVCDLEAAVDDQ